MNCQEVMELMQRQLDNDLDNSEMEVLNNHTRHCPDCADMFERMKSLSAELASLPKVVPSYSLVDAILPELEQMELLAQKSAIAQPSADSGSDIPTSARRLARQRRWPSWSAIGGVVAAGIVAGIFLVTYPPNISTNDTASLSAQMKGAAPEAADADMLAMEKKDQAGGDISLEGIGISSFAKQMDEPIADMLNNNKRNVSTESGSESYSGSEPLSVGEPESGSVPKSGGGNHSTHLPEETVTVSKEKFEVVDQFGKKEELNEADDFVEGEGTNEVGDVSTGSAGLTSEPDQESGPSLGIAALPNYLSPDGLYSASIEQHSIVIVNVESGETIMATSRKNGEHAGLEWSADGSELIYEVHLDRGAIEKYVIQASSWQEKKASH